MCRKFFWIKFEKKIRDRKSIDSQSLLSGLLDSLSNLLTKTTNCINNYKSGLYYVNLRQIICVKLTEFVSLYTKR